MQESIEPFLISCESKSVTRLINTEVDNVSWCFFALLGSHSRFYNYYFWFGQGACHKNVGYTCLILIRTLTLMVLMLIYYTPVVILLWTNRRCETMTGKQLVQGCYAATRVGVKPTTFELQGSTFSTESVPLHIVIATARTVFWLRISTRHGTISWTVNHY